MIGISQRDFAKRDGCSAALVRKRLKSGHLRALADGSLDPELVGSDWRPRAKSAAHGARGAQGDDVENVIRIDDRAFFTKAVAERIKENNLALLRQLEYDREAGAVVEIEDVAAAVVSEYTLVRNKLLSIGSKVAPRAAVMRSPEEVKALIDEEVYRALEELTLDGNGRSDPAELGAALRGRFAKAS